jgi:predicted Na+-dependent transporter|tara:strand:+ start:962 stop:1888 length:927 start_codon:yes stop_codon:yes gene_type:complete
MGTTIKYEDIDIRHPKLFLNVFSHQYILDPILTFLIVFAFRPPITQVYGMFILTVTPATAAASVTAYTVDANVPLALALSMGSLTQSIIFTPLIFTALVQSYSILVKIDDNEKISLPYGRMFLLMSYVMILIGIGYKIRQKYSDSFVKKIGGYLVKAAILFMLTAIGFYFASKTYIEPMTSSNPYTFYGSMLLMIFSQLLFAHFPLCNLEPKNRDAVVLVTTRRSPGISLAITALSFQSSENLGEIIAYVLVYGMIRDWSTLPYIMGLRKIRLGHYWYKDKKKGEQSDEQSNDQILYEEGTVTSDNIT